METIGQSRVMQLSRLVLLVTGVTVGRVVVPRDPVDRILSHVLAPLANDRKFDLPGVSSSFRCQHTLTSNKIMRVPPPSSPSPCPPRPFHFAAAAAAAATCYLLSPATACYRLWECLFGHTTCMPVCVPTAHVCFKNAREYPWARDLIHPCHSAEHGEPPWRTIGIAWSANACTCLCVHHHWLLGALSNTS